MGTPEETNINSLATLLTEKGLNANDFIDVVNALAKIKKREQDDYEKEEEKKNKEEYKIFKDKEYVFETRKDVFIYRDNRTKSGRYYIRIYDQRTRTTFSQSLKTTNRIAALASAEKIYAENKDRMRKGVKLLSINTSELVRIYLKHREKEISDVPHLGITQQSYDNLVKKLKYWEDYIEIKRHKRTKIEELPTELGIDFGRWIMEQPKQVYKGKSRTPDAINGIIAAVKKMYKDIAVDYKYITTAEVPIFKYLKTQKDQSHRKDVLTKEEYENIGKWMQFKWVNEKDITSDEKLKRRLFRFFYTIHYQTGMRTTEVRNLQWGEVSAIPTDTPEDRKIRRCINIPKEKSKTGKGRTVIAPIASTFERVKKLYEELGVECGSEDYVFNNISKTRRGKNIIWGEPLVEGRLQRVLEGAEKDGVWERDGRLITPYSARHYYATQSLMRKVDIFDLSLNMGTSVNYIESTYHHITSMMKSDEITKGQGYYGVIEKREKEGKYNQKYYEELAKIEERERKRELKKKEKSKNNTAK